MCRQKDKKGEGPMQKPDEKAFDPVGNEDAYIYQRKANAFLTGVDNIANEAPDDVDAFY
jgi:hypothetical protein